LFVYKLSFLVANVHLFSVCTQISDNVEEHVNQQALVDDLKPFLEKQNRLSTLCEQTGV